MFLLQLKKLMKVHQMMMMMMMMILKTMMTVKRVITSQVRHIDGHLCEKVTAIIV